MKTGMGIVGFGRFGRLAGVHLRDHFDLVVYDIEDCQEPAARLGIRTGSLEEVAGCSIVVLCVPISKVQGALKQIAPHLAEGALVVDTCSVKEYPVSMMKAILPGHVDILGSHPLFGPDSAARGLEGKKIVICPVRVKNFQRVVHFLRGLKLHVLLCSPEDHDRAMASTQAIVQFLGRAFLQMELAHETIATPGYERLIRILEMVQNDTWELFHDLQSFNPFSWGMRQRLIDSLIMIDQKLGRTPSERFESRSEKTGNESRISRRTRRLQRDGLL
jgi:prephenate dehydrogenase